MSIGVSLATNLESTRQRILYTVLVAGSVIMHFYFYNVDLNPQPIFILYLGIALQATSSTTLLLDLLKKEDSEVSLSFYSLYIFTLAFSQTMINLTRFSILPGTDLLVEVQTAQVTFDENRWDFSRVSTERYASSLAVTILPSVFAGATGVSNIYYLVGSLNSIFGSLIPVISAFVVSRLFGTVKIGIFSSVLLAQNYFFYYSVNLIMKTTLAVTLLLLGILCSTYKNRGYKALGAVFLSLVVAMHYTIGILALFFLASLSFIGRLMKDHQSSTPLIHGSVLAIVAGAVVGWLTLVSRPVSNNIGNILTSSGTLISELSTRLTAGRSSLLKGAETGYVLAAPLDPVGSAFLYGQNALILLGAVILSAEVIQSRINWTYLKPLLTTLSSRVKIWRDPDGSSATYILAGFSFLALSAAWIVLPVVSSHLSTFRMLGLGLMIAPFFMAVALYRFLGSLVILKAFAIIFLLLMLPMNMLITSHERSVLYHPIERLEPARQLDMMSTQYPTNYDLQLAQWLTKYLPSGGQVRTDAVGRFAMRVFLPSNANISWVQTYEPQGWTTYRDPSRYFLLNEKSVEHDLWAMARLRDIRFKTMDFSSFFGVGQNLIYNSEGFYLLNHA